METIVKINTSRRIMSMSKTSIGVNNENIIENLKIVFNNFIDGVAWLEVIKPNDEKGFILMNKVDESYQIPIKSSLLTHTGIIRFQVRITLDENLDGIPIFKSRMWEMNILDAINSITEMPEDYPSWIDEANARFIAFDNIDITQEQVEGGADVHITGKDGTTTTTHLKNGTIGKDGQPNTLTIGTVEPSENASATITGVAPNQILNLGLPQGEQGIQGIKGDKGEQGIQGLQGEKGDTGENGKDGTIFLVMTQAEYDSITPNPDTIYFIKGA